MERDARWLSEFWFASARDPHSKFLAGEDSYVLLTFDREAEKLTVEMKNLDGKVLDRQEYRTFGKN